MKILLLSHFFHPSVGGIEEVSGVLAHHFTRFGHEVKVVTSTQNDDGKPFPYPVYRRPNPALFLQLTRWCDVFFQNNISLQTAWPLLFVRRPWVVAHHTWLTRTHLRRGCSDGPVGLRDRLKRQACRLAHNISVSRAIAADLSTPSIVIGNPYRDDVFFRDPTIPRKHDLIFVGRLVSDKGADLLLDALTLLKQRGVTRELTIVGDGPDLKMLRERTHGLPVVFTGVQPPEEVARLLNAHRTLVAPSLWREPFGLTAIEAIACGCAVIGSDGGGLPDAIGPCGWTFPGGDVEALCRLLTVPPPLELSPAAAEQHLAKHRAEVVANAYLKVLQDAIP